MNQLILFIKTSLKEISPHNNIRVLHTNVKYDILSGITVGIIALPLALAFGEVSQLGPEAGLWSAVVGGIIGGLFGGCMVGVSGPTAPMASQIAAFIGAFAIGTTNKPDLVAAFSIIFLSGLILVGISMLKISKLIHFIPYSAIAGFMCGIGVIVILTQINPFLGLEPERNISGVFKNFYGLLDGINFQALFISVPCLLTLLLWPKIQQRVSLLINVPAALIALILGTLIAFFMNLDIPYIGDKMNSTSNSKIFNLYLPDLSRLGEFIGPAFLLAGLAVIDSLLSCKVADNLSGIRHSSDRETFGQGMANMASGLLGGLSTATATTQTVANVQFGALTPLATITKGIVLLGVLLGLGPLVATIPSACLAAILFKVGFEILDYRILPVLRKIPFSDLIIFFIVLLITIFMDLMIAIAVGVICSILISFKQVKHVLVSSNKHKNFHISEYDISVDKNHKVKLKHLPVNILKVDGPLFFGSVEPLMRVYNSSSKYEKLIIDMDDVNMIDLSGAYAIEDIFKIERNNNKELYITNADLETTSILKRLGVFKYIREDNINKKTSEIIGNLLRKDM